MRQLSDFNPRNREERDEMRLVMEDRKRRAFAAYWRSPGSTYPHPPDTVIHFECEGLEYVQLSADVTGPLATYRVRNDGQLKRLRRPPSIDRARTFPSDYESGSSAVTQRR